MGGGAVLMQALDTLSWSDFKDMVDSSGLTVHYHEYESSPNKYWVFITGVLFWASSRVDDASDVSDFEANYKSDGVSASSKDGALGKSLAASNPPVNKDGAPVYELGEAVGTPKQTNLTILSHDFSDPTTWYQGSSQVVEEELTDEGASIWASANPIWINTDHPNLFADELWNGSDYNAWWDRVGGYWVHGHFRPVIEVQVGGVGNWIVADPNDQNQTPTANYSHRIDYSAGKVKFLDSVDWVPGTKARATYYYTTETTAGSSFETGPPAGKIWRVVYTEVQLSRGAQWNDTVMLYGTQGGFAGQRFRYKSTRNMQCTASSPAWATDGSATTPAAYPSSADNGWPWPENLYGGYRNAALVLDITPWKYLLSKNLDGDLGQTLKTEFLNGSKFTETDLAVFTFYVKELTK
jgi:hypothetical protein